MQPDVEKRLLGGSLTSDFLGGVSSRLAGGLNLLPAGDSIQVGECIAAQNWRTAQAGMLFEKGMGNGNISPTPAITMPKPINRNIPGPACRKDKRGRTNFSSRRATLIAPTRS